MECHVAVSKESRAELAAQAVARSINVALGGEPPDLAFLFFSTHFVEDGQVLLDTVFQELAPKVVTGCMGEGAIGGTEELEGSPAVILWAGKFPHVHVHPIRLVHHEEEDGLMMRGWPPEGANRKDRPSFIVFADPFSTPIEEIFSTVERECPGSQVIGGIASGGQDLGENQLVLNQAIYGNGLVGVAVWGDVTLRTVVSQGCQPIGERYVVTKSERNIIYELGGVPTLERLQQTLKALGEEGSRKAAMGLQVGIAMDECSPQFEQGDFLIRGVIGADQNSGGIAVSDVVKEGQTVQFHVRDAQAASADLNMLLAGDRLAHPGRIPKGALLFSCNGRGRRFFPHPHHDVTAVWERIGNIPIAGFFAGGEIGPVGGKNYIHAYTASIALFCESITSSGNVKENNPFPTGLDRET